jgi:hypothetical protein
MFNWSRANHEAVSALEVWTTPPEDVTLGAITTLAPSALKFHVFVVFLIGQVGMATIGCFWVALAPAVAQ